MDDFSKARQLFVVNLDNFRDITFKINMDINIWIWTHGQPDIEL